MSQVGAGGPWKSLEDLLRHDPGQRKVAAFGRAGALRPASEALAGAERVLILTGFPVWSASSVPRLVPESDGPPGACALGRALVDLGATVDYVTDPRSGPLLRALGVATRVVDWSPQAAPAAAATLLRELNPTHLVAIELPGRSASGEYWSLRGEALATPALDELLLVGAALGVVTIGIGDGGNEAGLAFLKPDLERTLEFGSRIATVVPADHALVAGVSNWAAWALVAGVSFVAGRDLLPSEEQARADLAALAAAGAVDGILKTHGLEVDGRPWEESAAALAWARRALAE
ncbi:MAG: DUF4392 domain-containing protein [Planctomycetes bacterium]|nr:DUF4392 domain-containing protein [Planctomycetota bacterium]